MPQQNLINELEKDISFLKNATKKQIIEKIKKDENHIDSNDNDSYSSDIPNIPREYDISENEIKKDD